MKLPLAYYGDAVLRKKGAPVTEINDDIRQLVSDMIETLHANNGIGLAAPQVHRSLLLFITYAPNLDEEGKLVGYGPERVFINPKLSNPSAETCVLGEGCLSIPGLYADVTRPCSITISYQTLEGEHKTEVLSGWQARVCMHENDHINGVLYVDRLQGKDKKEMDMALLQLKKKISLMKREPPHPPLPHHTREL